MTEGTLLDLILVGIIVIFLFLGFWRGAVRSIMETAGILLGSEMALWWGDSIARRLVDAVDIEVSRAEFGASFLLLVATALGIGAFSANLLTRPPTVRRDRVVGAMFGFGNGVLFSALVIRMYQLSLGPGDPGALTDTRFAEYLWENFDYVLLTIVVAEFGLLLVNWILFPSPVVDSTRNFQASTDSGFSFATPRSEPDFASQVEPDVSTEVRGPVSTSHAQVSDSIGQTGSAPAPAAPPVEIGAQPGNSDDVFSSRAPAEPAHEPPAAPLRQNQSVAEPEMVICSTCGIRLDASDQYCPDCGVAITGAAAE